ncbi:MAG TPA: trehalose-phosphatase [Mycobacteriales bacterium]|nr:trehalose-phosphatase [Mycobacteriales bacterium]HWB68088.1 trehalose-phosphatase [Mycobacteriales bacterium]
MAVTSDAVAALLADPSSAVVAVDFDGTLAPIVSRPQDARPAPGAVDALTALAARIGAVAIVSGRAAEEVLGLAGLTAQSGIQVLGHYGLQSWREGSLTTPAPVEGVGRARARLAELLATADPGVQTEDKTHSVAVHTRGAADPTAALAALRPALLELAADCDLEAVPGRYVIELRPRGVDKGEALRRLVTDSGARTVIYLGDDLGDLPAYAEVERLRRDAAVSGLTVAVADPADPDSPREVAARADLVLAGPVAAVAWLAGLADMLDAG